MKCLDFKNTLNYMKDFRINDNYDVQCSANFLKDIIIKTLSILTKYNTKYLSNFKDQVDLICINVSYYEYSTSTITIAFFSILQN